MPEGVIYFHEFVGPNRWQWTDKQIALSNRIFSTFSQEMRKDLGGSGPEYLDGIGRMTLAADDRTGPERVHQIG